MRFYFVVLSTLALGLTCQQAFAFDHIGARWSASKRPVSYAVNSDSAPGGFESAIVAAAATWSRQSQIDFQFRYQGATNINRSSYQDNVHAVYYSPSGGGMDPTTLATTQHWTSGGQLVHFDIVFNGQQNWSSNPSRWQFDIESIALHEFGHSLGLAHSTHGQAVMYRSVSAGKRQRQLTSDDLSGAAALYPATTNASAPGPMTLIAPDGTITQQRPRFQWRATSNVASYSLELDRLSGSGQSVSVLRINNLQNTQYSPGSSLLAGQTYHWRIIAHSPSGLTSLSDTKLFHIQGQLPPRPIQVSPIRTRIQERRPHFKWRAVPGATAYYLWVNQANGQNGIIKIQLSTNEYKAPRRLPRGSYYYWWVRAVNSSGSSDWVGNYFSINR
jgi:hypothetical protein